MVPRRGPIYSMLTASCPRAGDEESVIRVLELFAGIGGCAAALAGMEAETSVVAAVDIHRLALSVYRVNFPHHPTLVRTIESLSAERLARFGADLWWLSPPCQPFTRRGKGGDDEDPRTRGLLALIEHLPEVAPTCLALENVPGFEGSRTHARLRAALAAGGYRVAERLLCPTELGVPNRRRRFYLVASRGDLLPFQVPPARIEALADFLDPDPAGDLALDPAVAAAYARALDVVDPAAPGAITACFTAAYGRSHVRSGSCLRLSESGPRRFSPREILRLLGFPASYRLPPELPRAQAWRLLGNSLSVPAVAAVLRAVPELAPRTPGSMPAER